MATTLIGYADASGTGMGIWFPGEYAGYQCPLPTEGPKDLIFFYEALAVYSAFHLGAKYQLGGVGHCFAWHVQVPAFCNLFIFLISMNMT